MSSWLQRVGYGNAACSIRKTGLMNVVAPPPSASRRKDGKRNGPGAQRSGCVRLLWQIALSAPVVSPALQ